MNASSFPAVVAAERDGRVLADNAAGSQLPQSALDAMIAYATDANAQKGDVFARSAATSRTVAEAKASFAELIGVPAQRVGLGANATSIAVLVSRALASHIRPGMRIVVTDADHFANVVPWSWLARFGAELIRIPVDAKGELDAVAFERALQSQPFLVTLPWSSNAVGTVYDTPAWARRAKAAGALVIVDGVQAAPHFPVTIDPAFDFVFFSAYKIFAPHFGWWYASAAFAERFLQADLDDLPSAPTLWSLEPGTQSHEGLAGWLGTVAYLRSIDSRLPAAMERIAAAEAALSTHARERFADRPALEVYGRSLDHERLPVFAFNHAQHDGHAVAAHLDRHGIEARFGDYYNPRLMKTVAGSRDGKAIRLSFAHYNSSADVDRCFDVLDAFKP